MHRYLPIMVMMLCVSTHAQVDQKKLDSLSRSIDSSAKAVRKWQDSFTKIQDSIYQAAIAKSIDSSNNLNQILAQKNRASERQKTLLRFLAGVVVVIIGIIAWLLKRKANT